MSNSSGPNESNQDKISIKKEPREKSNSFNFQPSSHYYTICIYGLIFVALATIIIMAIVNWSRLIHFVQNVLTALTPFVIAFFIAYILNPLVKRFNNLFEKRLIKRSAKARKAFSIAITYLLVFTCFTIVILYITPELINSAKDLDSTYKKINLE